MPALQVTTPSGDPHPTESRDHFHDYTTGVGSNVEIPLLIREGRLLHKFALLTPVSRPRLRAIAIHTARNAPGRRSHMPRAAQTAFVACRRRQTY